MIKVCPICGHPLTPFTGANGKQYLRCIACIALKQQIRNFEKLSDDGLEVKEMQIRRSYRRNMAALEKVKKGRKVC